MKEPIRIAQIIGKWVGGGVESVVMNYYRHIDKGKIQFDFICDSDSTNIPYEEIKELGGKVILIPPYQKVFAYHKELKKVLKEGKYQIVHSHINTLSVFPLFAAFCSKVPVRIAHSHSTTNKKEWKRNVLKQTLKHFSKVFATHYFSCSELAGRYQFGSKTYDKGQVYLLNNAINIEQFRYKQSIRDQVRKELNIEQNTFIIGHAGRFVQTKNHLFLLEIYNEISKINQNTKLMLIGQGPLEVQIKAKAKQLNLEDKIIFLGQRTDINKLYQAMDIFILPSLYEGLGMTLIEAQVSGLKCIASNKVPKEAEIIKNQVIFLDLNSKEPWIQECLNHKNQNRKISLSTVNNYNIKKKAKELEEFYLTNWRA